MGTISIGGRNINKCQCFAAFLISSEPLSKRQLDAEQELEEEHILKVKGRYTVKAMALPFVFMLFTGHVVACTQCL